MRPEPLLCSQGGIPYNKVHLDAKDAEIERLRSVVESLHVSANHERATRQAAERDRERLRTWQREARAWLAACLGFVTGSGPPSWDGIRAFLKVADYEQGATDGGN